MTNALNRILSHYLLNLRVHLGAKPREDVHCVIDGNTANNSVGQLSNVQYY